MRTNDLGKERSRIWPASLCRYSTSFSKRAVVKPDRDCWLVRFPDGDVDFWAVDDPDAGYECRTAEVAA